MRSPPHPASNQSTNTGGIRIMDDPILKQQAFFCQTEKRCSFCKEFKTLDNFGKLSTSKSGLHYQCKECRATYVKQYHNSAKGKTALKKACAKYMKTDKGKIALSKAFTKYFQTDRGKSAMKKVQQKRRAVKLSAECEDFNSEEIFKRDGYICQLCGKKTRPDFKNCHHPLYPNLDHIVPLSKGGSHTKKNTQCLCFRCNTTKHNNKAGDQLRMFG